MHQNKESMRRKHYVDTQRIYMLLVHSKSDIVEGFPSGVFPASKLFS